MDRRTDGQTDRIPRLHYMQRGKNVLLLGFSYCPNASYLYAFIFQEKIEKFLFEHAFTVFSPLV